MRPVVLARLGQTNTNRCPGKCYQYFVKWVTTFSIQGISSRKRGSSHKCTTKCSILKKLTGYSCGFEPLQDRGWTPGLTGEGEDGEASSPISSGYVINKQVYFYLESWPWRLGGRLSALI